MSDRGRKREVVVPEIFKLKVAARRQVTLPQRVLDLLNLSEGDVLEISVKDNAISGRGLKLIPSHLFTPEMLEQLRQREAEMNEGLGMEAADKDELVSKLQKVSPIASHA